MFDYDCSQQDFERAMTLKLRRIQRWTMVSAAAAMTFGILSLVMSILR